jgi:hypothetical protein
VLRDRPLCELPLRELFALRRVVPLREPLERPPPPRELPLRELPELRPVRDFPALELRLPAFLRPRGDGTFPPSRRASERPIAIACLGFFTFFFDRPEVSSPRFISCIARSTFFDAAGP